MSWDIYTLEFKT